MHSYAVRSKILNTHTRKIYKSSMALKRQMKGITCISSQTIKLCLTFIGNHRHHLFSQKVSHNILPQWATKHDTGKNYKHLVHAAQLLPMFGQKLRTISIEPKTDMHKTQTQADSVQ